MIPPGDRVPDRLQPPDPDLRPEAIDLASPEFYLNRELTWLEFNGRVLHEAEDERTPLLERVKFLAIVGSNLDEFFMKRIGGLKQQVGAGVRELTVDGRTPEEQILECGEKIRDLVDRKRKLLPLLTEQLSEQGIVIAHYDDLDGSDRSCLRDYYVKNIFPLVTPQAMDPAHPFPFVSNLSLNLLVTLHHPKDGAPSLARVKVPVGAGIPRLLRVRTDDVFVPLEEVMAHNLDLLVPGMEIDRCELFRVTRNADTALDEERADDLLAMIESELRERKFAPIVRLEVAKGMTPLHRGMLAAEFGLDEEADVFEVEGMLGVRDLMEVASLAVSELHDRPHHPTDNPAITRDRNIFHVLRDAGSILLQHPYESFSTSVERFLREASEDPKVRAIKMTLYRTSAETQVIDHLINAARNGKQVAVAVELRARFDEGANIQWASQLEEVGIHVSYGVVGLKTHCKTILVVRQDYRGLRRYVHIGTGNYHAGTARLYSDFGLLVCDDEIGGDVTELFNYLTTGYKPKRKYRKLLVAPALLKPALLEKIEREIAHERDGGSGLIQFKMNALEDADVTRALYRASQAGVKVDLVVRDTCRLRPGIPGVSDNVRVVSIVGRFLEHGRIFHFHNGGSPEFFIGSADCMKRNLEARVEALTPVEDPRHQEELRRVLEAQLEDPRGAWDMQPDGTYVQRRIEEEGKERHSQRMLIDRAEKRLKEATRLRKRKPKGFARRAQS
jgi:polyphosphate kinase